MTPRQQSEAAAYSRRVSSGPAPEGCVGTGVHRTQCTERRSRSGRERGHIGFRGTTAMASRRTQPTLYQRHTWRLPWAASARICAEPNRTFCHAPSSFLRRSFCFPHINGLLLTSRPSPTSAVASTRWGTSPSTPITALTKKNSRRCRSRYWRSGCSRGFESARSWRTSAEGTSKRQNGTPVQQTTSSIGLNQRWDGGPAPAYRRLGTDWASWGTVQECFACSDSPEPSSAFRGLVRWHSLARLCFSTHAWTVCGAELQVMSPRRGTVCTTGRSAPGSRTLVRNDVLFVSTVHMGHQFAETRRHAMAEQLRKQYFFTICHTPN